MNKTWAILVSVAEYDDTSKDLSFVHSDNDCIRHGLEKGLLIPREQIIVCGKNCAVKYSDFEDIISLYSGQIEQSDRVIIYFSGHGGGAPFSLRFTDICKDFSEVCAEIDRLPACAKIFIIDACHSGNGEVPELLTENPSHKLFDYAQSGYAVFASSNAGSTSTCHPEKAVSLYTYCFSNALCHAKIRNGKVSLIDVAKQAALEADYISKTHGITLQHPVFKCHIPGDVLFQITEERIINNNIHSSCHAHYDVYSTEILHSSIEMRYSVFAIAKGNLSDELIASYTMQIAEEIRPLRKFKAMQQAMCFCGKSTAVIFVFWGKSEEDVIRRNWIYMSRWAAPSSNRANWYRIDKDSKIVSDIWIKAVHQYDLLKGMYERDAVSNVELIQLTHDIADPLLLAACEVVKYFEEYDNGEIPEYAFMQACTDQFKKIQSCYWRMASLPVPSVELKEWVDSYDCLTASIDDMRIFYTTKTFLDREESNRKVCMRGAVSKYREDLRRLVHVEEYLKESGIIESGIITY